MNPAGIVIFYGAREPETALSEALGSTGRVSVGVFSPLRSLRILDLTGVAKLPFYSIFEKVTRSRRGLRLFMNAFVDDIAKVSARDGREHIDYVPAQIVTEYFRRVFRSSSGERLDGVVFLSTRYPQGRNVSLFIDRHDVRELSRYGDTLCFHSRLTKHYRVKTRDGQAISWQLEA